jgi:hypothetical protein
MNFAMVGKLAQTFLSSGAEAIPFETQFQFLNSEGGHNRFLSLIQPLTFR